MFSKVTTFVKVVFMKGNNHENGTKEKLFVPNMHGLFLGRILLTSAHFYFILIA